MNFTMVSFIIVIIIQLKGYWNLINIYEFYFILYLIYLSTPKFCSTKRGTSATIRSSSSSCSVLKLHYQKVFFFLLVINKSLTRYWGTTYFQNNRRPTCCTSTVIEHFNFWEPRIFFIFKAGQAASPPKVGVVLVGCRITDARTLCPFHSVFMLALLGLFRLLANWPLLEPSSYIAQQLGLNCFKVARLNSKSNTLHTPRTAMILI